MMPGNQKSGNQQDAGALLDIRGVMIFGGLVVFLFFGIFGGWVVMAPLSSGAVANGTVNIEGKRRIVQHLEGGIIAEIAVKEGQSVKAGDTVAILDQTRPRASLQVLQGQLLALRAHEARLLAERDIEDEVNFPDDMIASTDAATMTVLDGQRRIFQARLQSLNSQTSIQQKKTEQYSEEILGIRAEITAQGTQISLIEEEIEASEKLFAKGLQRKPKLLELKRRQAEIFGARAQNKATIARVEQNIAETSLEIEDLVKSRLTEVVQELRDVQTRISDVQERVAAAQNVLDRTVVVAPTNGIVVDLRISTAGAVIGPGEAIMDVVPVGEDLVIEARVNATDIDIVHPGLSAQIRLTAFNQRTTPVLDAVVERVSADILTDDATGEQYYAARLQLADGVDIPNDVELYPGMPVEILIVTGSRTTLEYLIQPLSETFSKALREQ